MSETREQIFTCEGCSKPIFGSDRYHVGTGVELCEECAPADRTTETEWHDISTAPKDWTDILLYVPSEDDGTGSEGVVKGWYSMKDGGFDCWMTYEASDGQIFPTHWIPLP
jgi:hypothetical protein